jgi:hypothetical protein
MEWIGFFRLRTGTSGGFYKHGNELSDFIKDEEFLG